MQVKLNSSWLTEAHYEPETQILTVTTAKGTKQIIRSRRTFTTNCSRHRRRASTTMPN